MGRQRRENGAGKAKPAEVLSDGGRPENVAQVTNWAPCQEPCRLLIPLRLGTGLNGREHWAVRARRVKAERAAVYWGWVGAGWHRRRWEFPLVATLTRISPRGKLLDDDNLAGSLKAVRDEVAKRLGVDDGDLRVRFIPVQERGPWGVRVEISGP